MDVLKAKDLVKNSEIKGIGKERYLVKLDVIRRRQKQAIVIMIIRLGFQIPLVESKKSQCEKDHRDN
jgi:hypothetical protein